jgi:hypothetical protein
MSNFFKEIMRMAHKSPMASGESLKHISGGLDIYMNFRMGEKEKESSIPNDKLEFKLWFKEYPDRPEQFYQHNVDYSRIYNCDSTYYESACSKPELIKNKIVVLLESYDYPYKRTFSPEKYIATFWNEFTVFEYTKQKEYTGYDPNYEEVCNLIIKGIKTLSTKYKEYLSSSIK